MKRILAFALALTLFAAPTVALAGTTNDQTVCLSVPGPSWSAYIAPGICVGG
jgi:hypothetical protein